MPQVQAEAFVKAQAEILSEAAGNQIANRADVDRIERKLIEFDGKFTLLQWMIGFNIAFTLATLWKMFGK